MTHTISKVADFTIKIIMIFTTIVALAFFAKEYPLSSLIFGVLNLIFVLAIITKGLFDIFSKD
jgi:hypothetical protein